MGGGSYRTEDFVRFSSANAMRGSYMSKDTRTEDIFQQKGMDPSLDPQKFQMRESVDGPDHAETTPVIIGLDVTGSMSHVLDNMARKGLKTVCEGIYQRRPISDPHICILGIGDVEAGDRAPLQATQFEADIRIFEQLEKLWLEKGGGGNDHESYILAWYFAQFRTVTDSFKKRGRKGFLFTVGDEQITGALRQGMIEKAMGPTNLVKGYSAEELYALVSEQWNVFHIIVAQGSRGRQPETLRSWQDVLGQNVSVLEDHQLMGETIVSIMELTAGRSREEVTASWGADVGRVLDSALSHIEVGRPPEPSLDSVL